ncbi:MAG: hypothetical protein ACEQSA_01165 [Weeksellaceae bacterium]
MLGNIEINKISGGELATLQTDVKKYFKDRNTRAPGLLTSYLGTKGYASVAKELTRYRQPLGEKLSHVLFNDLSARTTRDIGIMKLRQIMTAEGIDPNIHLVSSPLERLVYLKQFHPELVSAFSPFDMRPFALDSGDHPHFPIPDAFIFDTYGDVTHIVDITSHQDPEQLERKAAIFASEGWIKPEMLAEYRYPSETGSKLPPPGIMFMLPGYHAPEVTAPYASAVPIEIREDVLPVFRRYLLENVLPKAARWPLSPGTRF